MKASFSKRKNEEPTEIEIDSKVFTLKNETIPHAATATPKHTPTKYDAFPTHLF